MSEKASALRVLFASVFATAVAIAPRPSLASPPPPDVMERLAESATRLEVLIKKASYLIEGHIDSLNGDGKTTEVQQMKASVESDGNRGHLHVIEYRDDGKDKTAEGQKEALENDKKSEKERDKDRILNPFLPSQQPNYRFDVTETNSSDPTRIRISFVPKQTDSHTIEGAAWVDTTRGALLSAGFKKSRPGFFVDYIHMTMEFGHETPLGLAMSHLTIDGKGGFLFFRKHFRGEASLTEYRIVP